MRTFLEYIFFNIYNMLYLDGRNKTKKDPHWDAFFMMLGATCVWLILPVELYYFYILNLNIPKFSFLFILIFAIIVFVAFYNLFISNRSYNIIYEDYKGLDNKERRNGKVIAIVYIFLPFFICGLVALSWHNKL